MFRKLKAIEIAEGALLADIAVIFQLLTIYVPVAHHFFRIFVFAVFTIIVLRRGLYVGIMSMCVAIFVTFILTGPQFLILLLLGGMGGLFLGLTMKLRIRHVPLIALGTTGGALTVYVLFFLTTLLFAIPITGTIRGLHQAYDAVIMLMNAVTASIGLGVWWKHTIYPTVASIATVAFTYWWILFYVALWAVLCPVVIVIYTATNMLVRLLGYDVRPFPDGRLNTLLRKMVRFSIKQGIKRGVIKRQGASV